jgi:hypothetical protein
MHSRIRIFLALSLALAAGPAAAQPGLGACMMGETRTARGGYYELEYGLVIHQWIDRATCGSCDGVMMLRTVELQVFQVPPPPPTPSIEIPATVSVIGWKGSPECPVPDESVVIVPPRALTFVVPPRAGPTPFPYFARATFSPNPQFESAGFLKVEFPVAPSGSIPVVPERVITLDCPQCRQYQTSAFQHRNLHDACDNTDAPVNGTTAPYALRARGDCVWVTPSRRTSWGEVKSFYR